MEEVYVHSLTFHRGKEEGYAKARQEMKEYLEKNRTNYPDFMSGTHDYAMGMKEGYVAAFDEIINELFKED